VDHIHDKNDPSPPKQLKVILIYRAFNINMYNTVPEST